MWLFRHGYIRQTFESILVLRFDYTAWISIQIAIAIIIRFSVSEMKPSGTLLSPPTQAHFKSRFSTYTALTMETAPMPLASKTMGATTQMKSPANSKGGNTRLQCLQYNEAMKNPANSKGGNTQMAGFPLGLRNTSSIHFSNLDTPSKFSSKSMGDPILGKYFK